MGDEVSAEGVAERHTISFPEFELRIAVMDKDAIEVSFFTDGDCVLSMDYDTFREVIEAVGKFGLGLKDPYIGEYSDTREAIEA
jgi:hypothetical protein